MGERKLKISQSATLKCPNCGKKSRIKVPEGSIYVFECRKCKSKIETPPAKCCIICTYSSKKCSPAVEVHNKLVEIRKRRKN